MDIILMAGLWLEASVWNEVAEALRGYGHRPIPLELPGVDDRSRTATLNDQVDAAVAAVDAADNPVVVGHSAACVLAWILADRRHEAISRIVLVGGFPSSDGETYADYFETVEGMMPFPGWGPFEGADSADLDETTKEHMAGGAIPVPEGISRGIVSLTDEGRFGVSVTIICPEFSPEQAQAWVDDGQVPELAAARDFSFVDIESGHWPMITRPAELARLIHQCAVGD